MHNLYTLFAGCLFLVTASDPGFAQTSEIKPAAVVTANEAPTLNPEQKRAFAQVEVLVRQDAEYRMAVQKALEAQRAADSVYFAKIRKALPELGPYIDFLEKARNPAPSTPQQ